MSRAPGTPRQAMGKPPPGTDVVIVDPTTRAQCPPARFDDRGKLQNASEAIGEIVSRDGVSRFEGYYANDEADAERTRDGWFWSGDLGYRDEDGFFYFAGRTADWLRVDGENFAAAPVERILARFPGVVTAVVLPIPDPRTGDQAMAALELADPDAFDPAAFGDFLDHQSDLGTKWAPRFVRVTDAIPLTGTGKVDKRPLRDQYWRTADPVWWRPFEARGDGRGAPYRRLSQEDSGRPRGRVRGARPPGPARDVMDKEQGVDLEGRTVLITGANTGIGRATATALARRGARVHLACRSRARAQPVLDEITAAHGPDAASFLALDLSDLTSVRAGAEAYLATGEPLHVLINNAGVAGQRGQTADGFELAFGVNHLGHFLFTTHAPRRPGRRRTGPGGGGGE